ncbi:MAG TPA: ABC transporter substrate-binding protein [Gaiellaceae bacterium]|nr:ABC transporter substrate-binding protein [Gaiellaceae bacterium]
MHRRQWLAVMMIVAGASLLIAASFASASTSSGKALKKGGIFRYGLVGASTQVDPQLAYVTTAWSLEYATAAKLYNYPDKKGPAGSKLLPEVASKFTVSNNGRVYTFTIRPGFVFSDGTKVTAKNFKYAIERTANHDLASPGAPFIIDPSGTNIVGAKAVNDGKTTHVSGVVAKGNKLTIRLAKADGTFMAKITMPFFQATSTKVPLTKEVVNVTKTNLPSAGPYYMVRNDPDRLTQLRLNPHYKSGPGRTRPHNLAGVDVSWNLNEQTAFNQTLANQLDESVPPAAEVQGVAGKYGVNKSRFWTQPVNCTGYLPMNVSRSLFKGNLNLRKAINYVINRKDYVSQAGPYAGQPWTHLFNPGVPGWKNVTLYKKNLATAKKLAKGHFKSGKINVGYRTNSASNIAQSQIVRRDLISLGFKPGDITMKGFSGADLYDAMGHRNTDLDMGTNMGWCSDYPDPYDWVNILLHGGSSIQAENNVNYSYFNDPKWNKKMESAARLVGPNRLKVYGQLDLDVMSQAAPMAVERTYNNRYIFSNKVNPQSLVYQGIYQDFDWAAIALK